MKELTMEEVKILREYEKITGEDAGVQAFISDTNLLSIIEVLIDTIKHDRQEFNETIQNYDDNYRPISQKEMFEYGE